MDPVVITLISVIGIITVLLVVVSVHVIQVLRELKRVITRANHMVENVDNLIGRFHSPFGHQGGLVEGLKTGLNLAQAFTHWLSNVQTQNHTKQTHES